ncbi:MAG: DegT/DnrJ/EryC1/StrS family aminotransferase [Pirellulales bacterium]|nr:DegT/DnrJ/EryC1/StrS family aminotransferase [Pirellulales bacterium]
MIPITRPFLGDEEAEAAAAAVRSGWVTQGPRVAEFESAVADYCGTEHAVAVSSGTAALHLALAGLGIGPGDEVICPSMSFVATANAICMTGAAPVFADVERRTYNLDPRSVEKMIGPATKAIMVVHQIGLPADLERFYAIGRRNGLEIVEDAACALGSGYRGRPIGGHCAVEGGSAAACFSFHPRKVITTGEGGMVVTDRPELADRLRRLRNHGMSVAAASRHGSREFVEPSYDELGFNYRMSDIQAAVGVEQMKRLDDILRRRRKLAARYDAALADHPWLCGPFIPEDVQTNYQSYAARLADEAPVRCDEVIARLRELDVAAGAGIMLAHREKPHHQRRGADKLTVSEEANERSLLLPLYPQMSEAEVEQVVDSLWKITK